MLDWDTVALLDRRPLDERTLEILSAGLKIRWRCWMGGRQLDECTLAVLDGRESAGLGHSGVAGQETAG